MENKNIVFLAKSIDGYIAGKNGELDWLNSTPNPEGDDMGYTNLMEEIDAIVMGRTTYETVCGFGGDWPYNKHVFVLSNSLREVPADLKEKVTLTNGKLTDVLASIHIQGFHKLYIDGGRTVQNFLKEDLIDELRFTTIPIVLGDGIPLFSILPTHLVFNHVKTEVFLDQLVQSHYARKK